MNDRFMIEDGKKNELIVESFKQARAEIDSRLQTNINLILQKIVTCGAALGFLISQKYDLDANYLVSGDVQLLGFVLIPIIALLYDVLIARNMNGIVLLADFIKKHIEPLVPEVKLWETYVAQEFQKGKYTDIENSFLILFTLGTEIMAALIFFTQKKIYLVFIPILLVGHFLAFKATKKLRKNL